MKQEKIKCQIANNAEKSVLGDFFHSEKLLKQDETLDDLQLDGLMLIQKNGGYKFSTDSVLLSNFVKAKPNDVLVDLCSGSGVVAILACHKNKIKNAYMVELQPRLSDMAKRSLEYNGIKTIKPICADLTKAHEILGHEMADVVTVNPPYFERGETSESDEIAIAMHEIKTSLADICKESSKLLKFGGRLFMVHSAERLTDILTLLRKNSLEPKRLRVVYPKQNKAPNLVLVEAKKGGRAGLKIEPPLILNNDDGTETDELKKIYNRK